MSFELGNKTADKPGILKELEVGGKPFLAVVAALMVRQGLLTNVMGEQTVRAFSRVNPESSDRSALRGAAQSAAEQGLLETIAVGNLAPGEINSTGAVQWQMLYSGRSGAQYEPTLTPETAKNVLLDADNPWTVVVRTPVDGHLPRPLFVDTLQPGDPMIYDPTNRFEGLPTEYTMSAEELAGRAALYSSFGLLAVRPRETGIDGTIIHPQ